MHAGNVVLVTGVHGVSGRAAAQQWAARPDTTVYGLSRRSSPLPANIIPIVADLLDPAGLHKALAGIGNITHIVFAAYIEKSSASEKTELNVAILNNLMDAVESGSSALRHVTFYQGGKAYGSDLGPFKTPAREDDPRLMPPNFYYAQEDLLRARQQGKQWAWTAFRPEAIVGFGVSNPMNLGMSIAVYAAISRELGLPLRFPGTEQAYGAIYQVTYAPLLGKATVWAGLSETARNEIFNLTNGDVFRWRHLWPRLAGMFQMDVAYPVPMPLAVYMADKAPLWEEITRKYKLNPIPYEQIASWPFADMIFGSAYDNLSSTIKARRAGFADCIDTEDMFREFFTGLRAERVIP